MDPILGFGLIFLGHHEPHHHTKKKRRDRIFEVILLTASLSVSECVFVLLIYYILYYPTMASPRRCLGLIRWLFFFYFSSTIIEIGVHGLTIVTRRQALVCTTAVVATGSTSAALALNDNDKSTIKQPTLVLSKGIAIPRVGYSLYKTQPAAVAADGVRLALAAGVRHFDVATQYGTNEAVGAVLNDYIQRGEASLQITTSSSSSSSSQPQKKQKPLELQQPVPRTAARRRAELFVTHKVSNAEQSLDTISLQAAVLAQRDLLIPPPLRGSNNIQKGTAKSQNFMVLLHSPLTDKERRLRTYQALVELQQQGHVATVGVCHYGVAHLQEIVQAGLPPPQVIQLVLSPFHPHADVAAWATQHGSTLSCAAWSKLSSTSGPVQQWTQLGQLAAARGVTKQQILIRWAVQSGYLCVPRSGSQYKVERAAIYENAWPQVSQFTLSAAEMEFLRGLDVQLPAGQLGVTDGWEASEIVDAKWDPTLLTV